MATHAINTFRLRSGVSAAEFEQFSIELDQPRCLAFDVVLAFEVFMVDDADAGIDVIEVMTVASWPEWEQIRDGAPELTPVLERFDQLVEPGSVSTHFGRKPSLPQEI